MPVITVPEKASYDVVVTEAVRTGANPPVADQVVYADALGKLTSDSNIEISDGALNIGGAGNADAVLSVESTTQGVGLPNMTQSQVNALSSAQQGIIVNNTDRQLINYTTTNYGVQFVGWLILTTVQRLALVSPVAGLRVYDTDFGALFNYNQGYWCISNAIFNSTLTDALPPPEANEWADDGNGVAANTYNGGVYTAFQDYIFDKMTFQMEQESNPDVNVVVYQDFPKTGVFELVGKKIDASITSTGSFQLTMDVVGGGSKIHIYQGARYVVMFGMGSNQNAFTLKSFKANTVKGVNQNPVASQNVPSNFTTNINSNNGNTPATIDFRMSAGFVTPANGAETSPIFWAGN